VKQTMVLSLAVTIAIVEAGCAPRKPKADGRQVRRNAS